MDIAIVGGTGKQGSGLALRFALAGHHVIVGSRSPERARNAAARISDLTSASMDGHGNAEAVAEAGVVVVSVPYGAQEDIYAEIGPHLRTNAIVVDTVNPTAQEVIAAPGEIATSQFVSAAEEAAVLLPSTARLVAGFQTISASKLADLEHPLEGDVLLCGDDDESKVIVGELVEDVPNLRWVDAGGLSMARAVERMAGLLISVNKRYGIKGATVHLHGHRAFGKPPP